MRAYFLQPSDMSLELREAPQPRPGPDQMLVRVRAAGLNRGEFLKHGLTKPGAAKIGGTEGAGEVEGTGQRVMGRLPSSFAEYALMDKADAVTVPANMSWEEAAATPKAITIQKSTNHFARRCTMGGHSFEANIAKRRAVICRAPRLPAVDELLHAAFRLRPCVHISSSPPT